MRGKILILTGFAVGYVLGTRAGRERYEQIKRATAKLWNDPRVQQQVERVEDYARDKAPEVAEFIADGTKKVVAKVVGRGDSAEADTKPAAKKPAAKTASKRTSGTSTKRSTASSSK